LERELVVISMASALREPAQRTNPLAGLAPAIHVLASCGFK
jgi:hypothetical protein